MKAMECGYCGQSVRWWVGPRLDGLNRPLAGSKVIFVMHEGELPLCGKRCAPQTGRPAAVKMGRLAYMCKAQAEYAAKHEPQQPASP